jgi:hypothetical protein
MYLQTGDEHLWMAQERQYLEARRAGRPVVRTTFRNSRWTSKRSTARMDFGSTIRFVIAWMGRLLHPDPSTTERSGGRGTLSVLIPAQGPEKV